jgi:thiol-disulfide isomerase/thioredoxin
MKNTDKKSQSKKKYFIIAGIIAAGIAAVAFLYFNFLNPQENNSRLQVFSEFKGQKPQIANLGGLQIGTVAPNFKLIDPEKGRIITKQNFKGKPLFVLFVTATNCTPCQTSAESLAKYDDESGGHVFSVLIVSVADDKETNNEFIDWKQKYGREDWYIAKGIYMAESYRVKYLDTAYILDKNGVIKWVNVEPLDYSSIKFCLEYFCT